MKKMTQSRIPYEVIAKFFRKECNKREQDLLDAWIGESPSNQVLIDELKREWTFVQSRTDIVYPDKADIWKYLECRIHAKARSRSLFRKAIVAAASVALLIAVTSVSTIGIYEKVENNRLSEQVITVTSPTGQKTQMTLPDGTQVFLNSNSKLTYTGSFNKQVREVCLEGEAFFDVTKNVHKKFIVSTHDIKVSVLGTSFDVQAYPEDDAVSVSLQNGKVVVESCEDRLLGELFPNQLVVISKKDLSCKWYKNSDAGLFSSWKQNQLVFHNAGIDEILPKLERWYGVSIKTINLDNSQKYSFSVKTESLRELLDLLNEVMPISYKIEGEEVTISR